MTAVLANLPVAEFASAVAWVGKWAPVKPTQPIYGTVRVQAAGGGVLLSSIKEDAGDAHAYLGEQVDAGKPDATWAVSARLLAAIAGTLGKKGDVTLTVGDGGGLRLTQGRNVMTLPTMRAEDFPAGAATPEPMGSLPGDALAAGVQRTVVACNDVTENAVLACLRLDFSISTIALTGASRARFAAVSLPWAFDRDMLGPRGERSTVSFATPIGALLGDAVAGFSGVAEVAIGCDGHTLALTGGGRSVSLRIQDVPEWPDRQVRQVLDMSPPLAVTVDRRQAVAPLRQAALLGVDDKGKPGPVRLTVTGEAITLGTTMGPSAQSGQGEIEHDGYEGPDVTFKLNPGYLADALSTAPADTLTLAFDNPTRIVTVTTPDDPAWRHLVGVVTL